MTLQSMSFIFGAILLAVAILGGGFEIKEIKVSNVSMGVRALAGIAARGAIGLRPTSSFLRRRYQRGAEGLVR